MLPQNGEMCFVKMGQQKTTKTLQVHAQTHM